MRAFLPALSLVCLAIAGCGTSNEDQFLAAIAAVKDGTAKGVDVRDYPLADDALLGELRGLDQVREINLDRTPVTDSGIVAIGKLAGLSSLSLSRTQISDRAVASIVVQFPGLVYLRLDETRVTATGIKQLAELKKLKKLSLYRVPITSAACKEIAKIATLTELSLDQTMITDEGLTPLAGLESLKRLSIWQCQVSDEAVASFKEKRPDVKINR